MKQVQDQIQDLPHAQLSHQIQFQVLYTVWHQVQYQIWTQVDRIQGQIRSQR